MVMALTGRRHVKPTATVKSPAIIVIGKEDTALEEQAITGYDSNKQKEFTNSAKHSVLSTEIIRNATRLHGLRRWHGVLE